MVKTIEEIINIDGISPQQFFTLLYIDPHPLKNFHAQVNEDEDATVPFWSNSQRNLKFKIPFNAPAFIAKLVGSDCIEVQEQQTVTIDHDVIKVQSIPVPQIPGASNFSSTAILSITGTPHQCSIAAAVTCIANGPFGLTSTIEKFMAESARKSLLQFLNFCVEYIKDIQTTGVFGDVLQRAYTLPGSIQREDRGLDISTPPRVVPCLSNNTSVATDDDTSTRIRIEEPDQQQQEEEEEEEVTGRDMSGDINIHRINTIHPNREEEEDNFFDAQENQSLETILLYMHYLKKSSDQTTCLLRSLDSRLLTIEKEIVSAREERNWRVLLPEPPTAKQTVWLGGLLLVTTVMTRVVVSYNTSLSSSSST